MNTNIAVVFKICSYQQHNEKKEEKTNIKKKKKKNKKKRIFVFSAFKWVNSEQVLSPISAVALRAVVAHTLIWATVT